MARTIVSTPTTISIVAPPSPPVTDWLPARGSWAQVSLNRVDASLAGNFPPRFPSSRNMGIGGISDNFSGAVWNPHYGVLGAWVLWGGGHSQTSLENTVWIWAADTRLWTRLSSPTYPGDVPASPDWVSGDSNADFSEPLRSYGELVTGGAPAASHSRYHPCILPPGNGIGSAGALAIPYQSAFHLGGNTISAQGHKFDFSAGHWSRLGNLEPSAESSWSSCTDSAGNVYRADNRNLWKLSAGSSTWQAMSRTGWGSVGRYGPVLHIPGLDLIAAFRLVGGALTLFVTPASPSSASVTKPPMQSQGFGVSAEPDGSGAPDIGMTWCADLGGVAAFREATGEVWLLRPPSASPTTAAWVWSKLASTNAPRLVRANTGVPLYNRLQYAPSLKSFFICRDISAFDMWCFRPQEI